MEYGKGTADKQVEALWEEIAGAMHWRIKIRPVITWVASYILEHFLIKNVFEKAYEK